MSPERHSLLPESFYQQITDQVPALVYVKDVALGRYVYVNEAFYRWLGLPDASSLIGLTDADMLPPEMLDTCIASDRLFAETG